MYLQLLQRLDPAQARVEIGRYVAWIERDGTFWEVIDDETGERYHANFLAPSDDGMLWSAIFLDLLENPERPRRSCASRRALGAVGGRVGPPLSSRAEGPSTTEAAPE